MVAEWAVYAGLAASCGFFITVFLHMVANAFNLTSLRMWVKSEYMQVAASFFIIALAGAAEITATPFFQQVNGISSYVTGTTVMNTGNVALTAAGTAPNSAGDPSAIGEAYLKTVIGCEQSLYSIIYTVNFYFEDAGKLSYDVRGNEPSASGFALAGWVSLYHYINNNLVYLVLFHYVQYGLLQFASATMLAVFLPLGLVLRAFPLTRGAGGLVTAIALGFAFVFPMSYVLIVAMMPGVQGACTELGQMPQNQNYQTLTGGQDRGNPCLTNEGAQIENYYRVKMSQNWLGQQLDYYSQLLGLLFMQALFYPLAALIITFTFIRQTGSLFGADLAEIGRGLIKII